MPYHHPKNCPNQPPTQCSRPTHESDFDLITIEARKTTLATPSATANSSEIRLLFDHLNVPIAKESHEKPYSTPPSRLTAIRLTKSV